LLSAHEKQIIYALQPGRVTKIWVKRLQEVQQGQPLLEVEPVELNYKLEISRLSLAILNRERQLLQKSLRGQAQLTQKKAHISRQQAHHTSLVQRKEQCRLRSLIKGSLADWDQAIEVGSYLRPNQVLGIILSKQSPVLHALIEEQNRRGLKAGQAVSYLPSTAGGYLAGHIVKIMPLRAENLDDELLANLVQRHFPTRTFAGGGTALLSSLYLAEVELDEEAGTLNIGQSGTLYLTSAPKSWLVYWLRRIKQVLLSQSGF
jgi:putative peptide zinc metalloprotease protein